MKSRKLIIAFAVILPLIGIMSMVAWANSARKAAYDGAKLYTVVRVSQEVPAGTKTSDLADYVTSVKVPKDVLPLDDKGEPLYLTSLADAEDGTTDATIPAGQILLNDQILTSEEREEAYALKEGDLETTLKLDGSRGSSKSLRIGDKVTIFASFDATEGKRTEIVASSVVITQINGSTKADTKVDQKEPDPSALLTVAADPETIQDIIFVSEFGKVWLALENPASNLEAPEATDETGIGNGDVTNDSNLTDN